jgi:hypothetical protein
MAAIHAFPTRNRTERVMYARTGNLMDRWDGSEPAWTVWLIAADAPADAGEGRTIGTISRLKTWDGRAHTFHAHDMERNRLGAFSTRHAAAAYLVQRATNG